MANNPEYQRDPNYRKSGSSAGWWIAGVIAVVIIVAALYQNHMHNANNLQNIEPASGSNVTNSYDMQNSNTVTNTMSEPTTNTTTP
jgi:hypothetical protein